jgi:tRNA-binding protein
VVRVIGVGALIWNGTAAIKSRTGTVRHATGRELAPRRPIVSCFAAMPAEPAPLSYAEFERVDIRVGRIVLVEDFPAARKPAYKLRIDFGGQIGVKKSSAQATKHYTKEQLLHRLVVAVVNFPPKQIGPYISEVLTLGVPDGDGGVVLLVPEQEVPLGGRMF